VVGADRGAGQGERAAGPTKVGHVPILGEGGAARAMGKPVRVWAKIVSRQGRRRGSRRPCDRAYGGGADQRSGVLAMEYFGEHRRNIQRTIHRPSDPCPRPSHEAALAVDKERPIDGINR